MDTILNRTTLTDLIGFIDNEHGSHTNNIVNFAIFLDIFTIIINVLLIIVIVSERKLKDQCAYLQVINTSVSNICIGIFVIPLSIYSEIEVWTLSQAICHAWITIDVYLPFVNILIFICISSERILLSTKYYKCSRKFTILEIVVPWIFGMCIVLPIWIEGAMPTPDDLGMCMVHLNHNAALLSPIMTYFIPTWICIVLTVSILIRNFRSDSHHRINSLLGRNTDNQRNYSSPADGVYENSLSMISLSAANYIYIMMWFPHQFIGILLVFCNDCYPPYNVLIGITWLGAVTSVICPITWFTDVNIRRATKSLILSCKSQHAHNRNRSSASNTDSNQVELLDNCERSTSL